MLALHATCGIRLRAFKTLALRVNQGRITFKQELPLGATYIPPWPKREPEPQRESDIEPQEKEPSPIDYKCFLASRRPMPDS